MRWILFFKRWSALILILIGFFAFWYFDLNHYLNFASLKQDRQIILSWTNQHYFLTVSLFMLIYILTVTISIPLSVFFNVTSGFLFGAVFGTLYAVLSATLGATCLFLAIRLALEPWLAKKKFPWLSKIRKGFQQGSFSYLLIIRLIPLFPFWAVNIACALINIRIRTFIFATLIGILPNVFIHVLLGRGLGHVFDQNKTPSFASIFDPSIFFPLLALSLFAILPVIYIMMRKSFRSSN